ncbi:MAG: peptidoglycan DD-metalloendopeptidase family protein [Roseiflexaceae bacterium]
MLHGVVSGLGVLVLLIPLPSLGVQPVQIRVGERSDPRIEAAPIGAVRPALPAEVISPELVAVDPQAETYPIVHRLVEAETLGSVAQHYQVPIEVIVWANGLAGERAIYAGQELRIPRVLGVPYVIQPGDTIVSIATQYGVEPAAITLFRPNRIGRDADLVIGAEIFIPGAPLELPRDLTREQLQQLTALATGAIYEDETNLRGGPGRAYPSLGLLESGMQLLPMARFDQWVQVDAGELGVGWVRVDLMALSASAFAALPETHDFPPPPPRWVWPTYGRLTSPFGWRTVPFRGFHDGIDIANRAGTPILAARAGVVYEAGWCRGFGYCVKIDHGGGVVTIYGHLLKQPRVAAGDTVAAGDRIGLMGSTYDRAGGGYSTGVHLHFTIKVQGKAVNPANYLP